MGKRKRKYVILIIIAVCVGVGIAIFLFMKLNVTENEKLAQRINAAVDAHLFPEEQFTYTKARYFGTPEIVVCKTKYDDMEVTFYETNELQIYAKFETQYDNYTLSITYYKDKFLIRLSGDFVNSAYTIDTDKKLIIDPNDPVYYDNPRYYNGIVSRIPETVIYEYMEKLDKYMPVILEQIETNEA